MVTLHFLDDVGIELVADGFAGVAEGILDGERRRAAVRDDA